MTGVALHNLATSLIMLGRDPEAEAAMGEALSIRELALGSGDPETLMTKDHFGVIRRGQHRYREAEEIHRGVLEAERRAPGPRHPNTLTTLAPLANVLADDKRCPEAEALDREALDGMKRVLGPGHMKTSAATNHLAFVLELQGKYSEAEGLLRPALALFEKTLPGNWQRFNRQSLLGESLAGQKRNGEAQPLLVAGYQGMLARKAKIPAEGQGFLIRAGGWRANVPK